MNLQHITPETEFPITVTKQDWDEYTKLSCKKIYEKLFDIGCHRIQTENTIQFIYRDELKDELVIGRLDKNQYEKLKQLTDDYMKQICKLYLSIATL